jgi:hypothetical protein
MHSVKENVMRNTCVRLPAHQLDFLKKLGPVMASSFIRWSIQEGMRQAVRIVDGLSPSHEGDNALMTPLDPSKTARFSLSGQGSRLTQILQGVA